MKTPSKKPVKETKRKPGRPEEKVWPEPIDATPEEVARAILNTPPKKAGEWKFLREHRERQAKRKAERN